MALTNENMHADKIKQDVLFFSGENDCFIPIRLHNKQVSALVNAKSVTRPDFHKKRTGPKPLPDR